VKSPDPAFHDVDVPLASTFLLSAKPGSEAYIEPIIKGSSFSFAVRQGKPHDPDATANGTKLGRGANFKCLVSGSTIPSSYIYQEANAGRMGHRLMAIVAEGNKRRAYLSPTPESEAIATSAKPFWKPDSLYLKIRDGSRLRFMA
jgi:putative DNA methylase